jgi:hypothetical protein
LAVASSDIVDTAFWGEKCSLCFEASLALNRSETSISNNSNQSDMAEAPLKCRLIVWGEVTMAHKGGLKALDRTMQDSRVNGILMG